MVQKEVLIGDVVVPVIEDGGEMYYPISYITQKVLLRDKNGLVNKSVRDKYNDSIREFAVDFKLGSKQMANCIKEDALKKLLNKTQTKRLTTEKRISQNKLHEYLGINQLLLRESIKDKLNDELLNEHNGYTKEIILHEMELNGDVKFQLCSKCNKYHPLTKTFYNPDIRKNNGFNEMCHICVGKTDIFRHYDKDKYKAMQLGTSYYEAIKDGSVIKLYDAYVRGDLKQLPDCYNNKEGYLQIIKHLNEAGEINTNNLSTRLLINKFKLKYLNNHMIMDDVYKELYGNEPWERPWKYENFQYKNLDYETANIAMRNYIDEFNIHIDDVFNHNYVEIIRNSRIRSLAERDLRYFVVQYYEFKYPGYKFKISGVNYYKDSKNVLFDLKYLVEKDMKLEIAKIPLYLTNYTLHKKSNPLYNHIVTKGNGDLFHWVDQLYPNVFNEMDFDINFHRNEFDSLEEARINDLLEETFNNVIYNNRKGGKALVSIEGMQPDWLIIAKSGCWLIEYFGMYIERQKENTRVKEYIDKTHRKIEKYNRLENYRYIFLYPDDIEDDYFGCREKLKEIG